MKLDTSVAPELALLAGTFGLPAHDPAAGRGAAGALAATIAGSAAGPGGPDRSGPDRSGSDRNSPTTIGYLAACLRLTLADPQRWWDLVRFDLRAPVHIPVPSAGWDCA